MRVTEHHFLDDIGFVDEEEGIMEDKTSTSSSAIPIESIPDQSEGPEVDWRQSRLTFKSKLEFALTRELFTDLTCLVGQGPELEEVKCHSFLLRIHSAPFNQDFMEKNLPSRLELPKFSPSPFKNFLLFLYTEKFHASVEEAISLLEIGDEFKVEALVERCSRLLKEQMDIPNSSRIYAKAKEFNAIRLQEYAHDFILRNMGDVFKTQGFLELSHPCLKSLLESQQRNIDEVFAFDAMVRWAKEQCERGNLELTPSNLRLVLDGCAELINYEKLTAAEFSERVVDTEVLPEAVALRILKKLHLNQEGSRRFLKVSTSTLSRLSSSSGSELSEASSSECSSPGPTGQFPYIPQQQQLEQFRMKRFKQSSSQSWIPGGIEKITFMCNKPMRMAGVGLYGRSQINSAGDPLPIKASLTLSSFDELAQIASVRRIFPGAAGSMSFDFLFDNPATLEEKRFYTLIVEVSGEVQPSGTWGKKKVHLRLGGKETVTIRFMNPKGISARTRTGQFPELLFCP